MSETQEYGLLFAFDDESPSFVNGFEAGMIYQEMDTAEEIRRTIHRENLGLIQKMAARFGWKADIEEVGMPEWLEVTLTKKIKRVK
jgi:hypothetical protein